MQKSPITMRCTSNRTHLKATAGTALFVAVDLTPTPVAVQNRVNVSLAIDSSGSMDGEKMAQAKEAALNLVKQLKSDDQVSIIAFADSVDLKLPTSPVGNYKAAEAAIKAISVQGLTAMYDALDVAFKQVRQVAPKPGVVNRVLLVTDGMPTVGKTDGAEFVRLAKAMRDSSITITAIGIGNDYNEHLLTQIAQAGGGLWHHIRDARRDLPQIFKEQVQQMTGTVLASPELKVTMMPGAELADAYVVKPMLTRLPRPQVTNGVFTLKLKDLVAGQDQNVVFRVGVSAKGKGPATLMRVALKEIVQDIGVTFTEDAKLYSAEANPYPRMLLSSAEATNLMQTAIAGKDEAALRKAETILKTIASDPAAAAAAQKNPVLTDVVETARDAQATVARTGLQMSEDQKKGLLQETIMIKRKKPKR